MLQLVQICSWLRHLIEHSMDKMLILSRATDRDDRLDYAFEVNEILIKRK